MNEIAEELSLPAGLGDEFYNRGYYGTVNHNAKAVYQKYLGWFDGNPAHLHPLPPVPAAHKYVEFMGGADALLANARTSFERGEYRWVVEVVNHLVFAEPDNTEARQLQADALEQLGYQAESGPWRAFYLTGAQELRHGAPKDLPAPATTIDTMRALTAEMLFDLMGVRLDGPAAADLRLRIDLRLREPDEDHALTLRYGALSTRPGAHTEPADARVSLTRLDLARLLAGAVTLEDLLQQDGIDITGDADAFGDLLGLLDRFELWFDIVLP